MTFKISHALFFTLLLCCTLSDLVIQSPLSLKKYFSEKYGPQSNGIPYSLGNFGYVPYGRIIVGELATSTVIQNCKYDDVPNQLNTKKIILSERDNCRFTQKALQTQKQGGIMSIVIDYNAQLPRNLIMSDDGRGAQIHIPTVLISLQDGNKILQTMQTETVSVSVSFQTIKSDKVAIDMFLDITQRSIFIFLRKLQPFFEKIKKFVNLTVNYATIPCIYCREDDCFYNKTYCKNMILRMVEKGQTFIKQELRQHFIYQKYPDKWWNYMDHFDEHCSETTRQKYMQNCSINSMKAQDIDADLIIKLVNDSFKADTNDVLKKSYHDRLSAKITQTSIVVNNITYRRGNHEAYKVHELICYSFTTMPADCMKVDSFEPKY